MAFCKNCGKELPDGARFCCVCGVGMEASNTERKFSYEGEIHKCPNCGDLLDAYEIKCETCGWERRSANGMSACSILMRKLEEIDGRQFQGKESNSLLKKLIGLDLGNIGGHKMKRAKEEFERKQKAEKISCISSLIIPNTKEDILEVLQFALAQIAKGKQTDSSSNTDEVYEAWVAKFKQCDQKAQVMLAEEKEYIKFQELNQKTYKKLKIQHGKKSSFFGSLFH